jgi:protein phosphatase
MQMVGRAACLGQFLVREFLKTKYNNLETILLTNTASSTSLSLEIAALTDPGLLRTLNEDSIATVDDLGLLVLADGMGGYQSGDAASSLATQIVVGELTQALQDKTKNGHDVAAAIEYVVNTANKAIYLEGRQRAHRVHSSGQDQTMGSTLALLLLRNNQVTMAHVGDSRIYRLRANRLELMTHDHSLLQEQIDLGVLSAEAAASSHNRHLVTRGLGLGPEVEVTLDTREALPGDLYLVCSDGLNDMVDNEDIELALNSLQANLPLAASQLIMIANDNGGQDNISVILAKVRSQTTPAAKKKGFFARLLGR